MNAHTMYIKRDVLDALLVSDEDIFGITLSKIREHCNTGNRVIVQECDGLESLLEIDSNGEIKTTPIGQ